MHYQKDTETKNKRSVAKTLIFQAKYTYRDLYINKTTLDNMVCAYISKHHLSQPDKSSATNNVDKVSDKDNNCNS